MSLNSVLERTQDQGSCELVEHEGLHQKNIFKKDDKIAFRFQMAAFLMQNNLPFNLSEKLMEFIKGLLQLHSAEKIQSFTINRNHVSAIASECIGEYLQKKYLNILENTYFSIAIDEGSIKGNIEYLAINARFLENESEVTTKLIGLIEMGASSTGETLYNTLNAFLFSGEDGNKRKKMFMGIAADEAPNMISLVKGVTNRFKAEIPYLEITHDFCHVLNLILRECIGNFPQEYVTIVDDIAATFSRSPQKTVKLRTFLVQLNVTEKLLSMKKYVKNRWSSFQECLERVLELTLGLKQYFEVNGTPKQREYFKEDGPNIVMLQLLLCLVNKLNHYIITFQEENMDIQKVVRKLKQCALGVGEFLFNILDTQDQKGEKFEEESFVDSDYMFDKLRPLIAKDITKDSDSYKNSSRSEVQFQSFFLDAYPHLKVFLENKDSQFCNNFFKVAHEFLETAFERIKKKFPFTDNDSCLMCVDGFLLRNKSSLETLKTLAARFDNVIPKEHFSKFNEEVNDLVHEGKRIGKKVK